MSDSRNWNGTGEQLKNALSEALQSGDFKNLNDLVSQTVTDAINAAGKHVPPSSGGKQWSERNGLEDAPEQKRDQGTPVIPIWQQRAMERERARQERLRQEWQKRQQRMGNQSAPVQQTRPPRKELPVIKVKKVGSVSNVLYQVFGGIGFGITGLITIFRLVALAVGDTTLGGWIVNFLFLAGFYGMIRFGIGQKRRLKRAQRYLQLCDYRVYGEVAKLAAGTGKSEEYVVRDLQKMLALGIFPEGHLDQQKTCFMLSDDIYRQYLETENNCRLLEEEKNKAAAQQHVRSTAETDTGQASDFSAQETELHAMIAEGMECIRKLHLLHDKIPGEVISSKLLKMENLLKNLFDSVREHPEQMHRMHKLMNYYLPTTLKLVEAYEEFDRVNTPGDDIIAAKAEIENTLDTINQAYTELLNNLFQDAVLDVTTDAQVLKTMLAREGLMSEMDFK